MDETEKQRRAEFGRRAFGAHKALETRLGRNLSLAEIGQRVASEEGKRQPYAPTVVRRWLRGLSPPRTLATVEALARVLETDPGYLAFGAPPHMETGIISRDRERRVAEPEAEHDPKRRA